MKVNKYVSEFVKRHQAINAIPIEKLLWMSKPNPKLKDITFIKQVHGPLTGMQYEVKKTKSNAKIEESA